MKRRDIATIFVFCCLAMIVACCMKSSGRSITSYSDNHIDGLESISIGSNKENLDHKTIISNLQTKYNNNDIKALLKISNTDYFSVVPQGSDNSFYLRHLADKKYSRLGATFLDYRVDVDNSLKLLIYGHNSSKYDMPFKILENYYDREYYNAHKYIELITVNGIKTYEIFSIYVETKDYAYYQKVDFKNKDSWYEHISRLKNKSFYDTGVEIDRDDKILILQTCSTHKNYKKYAKKFLLIISREI